MLFKFVKVAFWAGLFAVGVGGSAAAGLYYQTLGSLPDVEKLKEVTFETPMKIYTADNKLIGEFGESKRIPVSIDKIPERVKQAFLAIEDTRFYEHSGIDPISIMRAAIVSASSAQAKQGASTITQQVARNFFLTREKTIKRKLKEMFISLRIEQVLTKDEILELYLNKIALGHRSYGVAAAAQTYYGKTLDELTLGQIATIAGLPKAPSTLNPISNPLRSKNRRHVVLERMYTLGYISKEEYEQADNEPYKAQFHSSKLEAYAPYVAEKARQFAINKYGEDAYNDRIEVYTSVNSKNQEAAHYAVFKAVTAYDSRHGYRGAKENIEDRLQDNSLDIDNFLYERNIYHYIKPAVVTSVDNANKCLKAEIQKNKEITISFDNLKWANRFISDKNQGPAPKVVSDVVSLGDVIYYYINERNEPVLTQIPDVEASIVALNQYTGAIEAMVGGYDFAKSKFDRTAQATRQTGSNFKPFLYSAAVAKGININSIFQDEPIKTWDPGSRTWWSPKNSPNRYDGPMTLREGLARSKNVVSIRLIRQIGVHNVVEHVKKFGFDVPRSQQVEAMALGSVEVTPLELVTGYATFSNGGYKIEPYLITKIVKNGEVIYANENQSVDPTAPNTVKNSINLEYLQGMEADGNNQVLSHDNAYIVADMMRSVIYGGEGITGPYWGTGGRAQAVTGRTDLHGKTGTTNNVHDAWFSGFNGNIVATSWMGFDTDRDLGWSRTQGPEGGAYSALPIWAEFVKLTQKNLPPAPLPVPAGLGKCNVNGITDWCVSGGHSIQTGSSETDGAAGDDGQTITQPGSTQSQTEVDTSDISTDDIF
ncbi:MAG: PBP1A family penicillin-binding protein [Aeromonadales bacterium]|nr:PBP1A family penicillin-binding protein [Aeromonadales bacterium]